MSTGRDGESFTAIGMHMADSWRVRCNAYRNHTPILNMGGGSASVDVSIRGERVDETTVAFARELAREAARFAAEVERLYAEKFPRAIPGGTCAGCGGAVGSTAA